jgi:hypothetical protein
MSIGRYVSGRVFARVGRVLWLVPLLAVASVLIGATAAASRVDSVPAGVGVVGQGWRITLLKVSASPALRTVEEGSTYTTTAGNGRTYLILHLAFRNLRYPARKTAIDSLDAGLRAGDGSTRKLVGVGHFDKAEGWDSGGGCTLCSQTISVSGPLLQQDFAFNVAVSERHQHFTFRYLTVRLTAFLPY